MMLDFFVTYVVNIKSAHQVEFTQLKSLHSGIKSTQWPCKVLREYPGEYKVPFSGRQQLLLKVFDVSRLFLRCRSWSTIIDSQYADAYSDHAVLSQCVSSAAGILMRALY